MKAFLHLSALLILGCVTAGCSDDAVTTPSAASSAKFTATLLPASEVPPGTALTASHIHPGIAGVNGGVLVSLGLAPGEVTFATGSGSFTKQGVTMTVDQANSIIANPAGFYLNIHTAANPGGVARGQLAAAQ